MLMELDPLREQLALYHVEVAADSAILFDLLDTGADKARLTLRIDGLESYATSWGERAATWLLLAVVRMVKEIIADYENAAQFGVVLPDTVGIVTLEDYQQEIGHRCVTAYQDIYDVLLHTHQKPSSPIWHRRAVTQFFPQLVLEVEATGSIADEDDNV